jgi:hypothetical protein
VVQISAHGLGVELTPGWEAEVYVREPEVDSGSRIAAAEEVRMPVLHAANFAMPADRGDFGSGAVELMRTRHAFVALLEHGPDALGTALFANAGRPVLDDDWFRPEQMQRPLAGQSGAQHFFHENGRAFCLYVALGSHLARRFTLPGVRQLVASLRIDPA